MTSKPSAEMTNVINNALGQLQTLNDIQLFGGKIRVQQATITYASQATTDTIPIARLPVGALILGFMFLADTSSGSATIAIVDAAASPVTYVAAAAFTATDTPTWKGKAAIATAEIASGTDYLGNAAPFLDLIVNIASAALPSSGTLLIRTFYTDPSS